MKLKVGMRVENDAYGEGVVTYVWPLKDEAKVTFNIGAGEYAEHFIYSEDGTHWNTKKNDPAYTLREVVTDPNPMPEFEAGMVIEVTGGRLFILLPNKGELSLGWYDNEGDGNYKTSIHYIKNIYSLKAGYNYIGFFCDDRELLEESFSCIWSKTSEKDSKIEELEKALKEQENKYNESVKEIRDKIEELKK